MEDLDRDESFRALERGEKVESDYKDLTRTLPRLEMYGYVHEMKSGESYRPGWNHIIDKVYPGDPEKEAPYEVWVWANDEAIEVLVISIAPDQGYQFKPHLIQGKWGLNPILSEGRKKDVSP